MPFLSNPVGQCFDGVIEGDYQHMVLGLGKLLNFRNLLMIALFLGDVIAPGYLIAFAFYLDVRKMNRFHFYGFTTIVGEFFNYREYELNLFV
jgi:hypothetical protein